MRKRSKLQKKIQRSTNHQTKENALNQIKQIEQNLNILINTKRNLRETRAIAAIKKNKNKICKFVKNNSSIRAGIGPLQDEDGKLEPSNKKMSELLNEQYDSVFSTPAPMMIISPKDLFGHPKANTLSDINITREDIIDAIKTISQNSSGGPYEFPTILLKQRSKSQAHHLQLLYKASLKTDEMPIGLKRAIIKPIYNGGSKNLPKNYSPVDLT